MSHRWQQQSSLNLATCGPRDRSKTALNSLAEGRSWRARLGQACTFKFKAAGHWLVASMPCRNEGSSRREGPSANSGEPGLAQEPKCAGLRATVPTSQATASAAKMPGLCSLAPTRVCVCLMLYRPRGPEPGLSPRSGSRRCRSPQWPGLGSVPHLGPSQT